jgi:hypothetical protein
LTQCTHGKRMHLPYRIRCGLNNIMQML